MVPYIFLGTNDIPGNQFNGIKLMVSFMGFNDFNVSKYLLMKNRDVPWKNHGYD